MAAYCELTVRCPTVTVATATTDIFTPLHTSQTRPTSLSINPTRYIDHIIIRQSIIEAIHHALSPFIHISSNPPRSRYPSPQIILLCRRKVHPHQLRRAHLHQPDLRRPSNTPKRTNPTPSRRLHPRRRPNRHCTPPLLLPNPLTPPELAQQARRQRRVGLLLPVPRLRMLPARPSRARPQSLGQHHQRRP